MINIKRNDGSINDESNKQGEMRVEKSNEKQNNSKLKIRANAKNTGDEVCEQYM